MEFMVYERFDVDETKSFCKTVGSISFLLIFYYSEWVWGSQPYRYNTCILCCELWEISIQLQNVQTPWFQMETIRSWLNFRRIIHCTREQTIHEIMNILRVYSYICMNLLYQSMKRKTQKFSIGIFFLSKYDNVCNGDMKYIKRRWMKLARKNHYNLFVCCIERLIQCEVIKLYDWTNNQFNHRRKVKYIFVEDKIVYRMFAYLFLWRINIC
jgi:hypothetical protein